jgi:hypothetical protein
VFALIDSAKLLLQSIFAVRQAYSDFAYVFGDTLNPKVARVPSFGGMGLRNVFFSFMDDIFMIPNDLFQFGKSI